MYPNYIALTLCTRKVNILGALGEQKLFSRFLPANCPLFFFSPISFIFRWVSFSLHNRAFLEKTNTCTFRGWEWKRSKCFFNYIHLDFFPSHPAFYKCVFTTGRVNYFLSIWLFRKYDFFYRSWFNSILILYVKYLFNFMAYQTKYGYFMRC